MVIRRLPDHASTIYGHRDYLAANPDPLTEARHQNCRWIGFDSENAQLLSWRACQYWLALRHAGMGDQNASARPGTSSRI